MQELRVALIPIARVNFDMELAEKITSQFRSSLIFNGLKVVQGKKLVTNLDQAKQAIAELADEKFELLLIFQATFADSTMVTYLAEQIDKPIFLWSVPEEPNGGRLRLNSLCGINLAGHALSLAGREYDFVYTHQNDTQGFKKVRSIVSAASVVEKLKSTRLGVVGEHPAGMDTCHLDASELRDRFGVDVVNIDLNSVFERVRSMDMGKVEPVRARLDKKLSNLNELDQSPVNGTLSTYVVLSEIAKEEGLDGIAVRCWPEFFTDLQCSACGAISMLTDNGIPCSCEADANGTITQLMLQWLSDSVSFGTDMVSVNYDEDHFVVWHCGLGPLSLADPAFQPRGTIHSNRRLPLLMEFPFKPGEVTAARLSRTPDGMRLVVGRGEMLSAPLSFSGTSGVLRFESPAEKVLDTIIREGLEHHIAITYGDYKDNLIELSKMLNLPLLQL
jgi:L-fucose isomerase-like protein